MKNCIRNGILLAILPFILVTTAIGQSRYKRFYEPSQAEFKKTTQQLQQQRGYGKEDFFAKFEIVDKFSGNPISGLETKMQDKNNRDITQKYYYGSKIISINPYIDTTDANGVAVFSIQKEDVYSGKLSDVVLTIRGNENHKQKKVRFNLASLISVFKSDPTNVEIDSSLSSKGLGFTKYSSFIDYIMPLSREEDNPTYGFEKVRRFEPNRNDIDNWSRSVMVLPFRISMDRIPLQIDLQEK